MVDFSNYMIIKEKNCRQREHDLNHIRNSNFEKICFQNLSFSDKVYCKKQGRNQNIGKAAPSEASIQSQPPGFMGPFAGTTEGWK